jgi:hypothetical protein
VSYDAEITQQGAQAEPEPDEPATPTTPTRKRKPDPPRQLDLFK